VSDLHFGAGNGLDDEPVGAGIRTLVERIQPELVIVSGDLTHGGRAAEHETAARFLESLGRPLLVIPGNHDIPPFSPARFTRTWGDFNLHWNTTSPVYSTAALQAIGLNSVRPLGYQRGRLRAADLERAERLLAEAQPGALRVVAIHHQLTGAPWRVRKLPLIGRSRVLARLADAGAELIVGGHIHQATVCERRDFEVLGEGSRPCVIGTAPGLGRPRPGRRYEVRGALVHRFDERSVTVETNIWSDEGWVQSSARTFPRALTQLAAAT
jgi:3',5'-cyclic AMP phosphodiesterase CpdA